MNRRKFSVRIAVNGLKLNMITNKAGITEIKMKKVAHCFCPLGSDWYTAHILMTVKPDTHLFDYCDVDNYIKNNIEGKKLIIEEIAAELTAMCQTVVPFSVEVEVHVEDAVHLPVTVKKVWNR